MSVTETISFDKEGKVEVSGPRLWVKKLFLALLIGLIATLAFGIGRLTAPVEGEGIKLEWDSTLAPTSQLPPKNSQLNPASAIQALPAPKGSGEVVASKNGSKYHYLHCTGAKQIREENKLFFPSPASAEASGYTLAGNCLPR